MTGIATNSAARRPICASGGREPLVYDPLTCMSSRPSQSSIVTDPDVHSCPTRYQRHRGYSRTLANTCAGRKRRSHDRSSRSAQQGTYNSSSCFSFKRISAMATATPGHISLGRLATQFRMPGANDTLLRSNRADTRAFANSRQSAPALQWRIATGLVSSDHVPDRCESSRNAAGQCEDDDNKQRTEHRIASHGPSRRDFI